MVDEVRVEDKAAIISGSYERLIAAVQSKKEDTFRVPTFMREWRVRRDSNSLPLGSKPSALSK